MKRAPSSFSLLIISTFFVSFQSYAQVNWQQPRSGYGTESPQPQYPQSSNTFNTYGSEMISQRIQQSLRMGDRLGLSQLLRLSPRALLYLSKN